VRRGLTEEASMTSESNLYPPHVAAWQSFLEAHRLVTSRLEEELLAAAGVPLPWYDVLARLADSEDNRCRMQELAQAILISKSGLTRLVDRMQRAGLVVREACEEDRRGTFAALTEDGKELLDRCAPVYVRGVTEHFVDLVDEAEALTVAQVMSKVASKARPDA
jgi:DNA-binding MarR family transcriptional regulator